jgi:hypothetical protein
MSHRWRTHRTLQPHPAGQRRWGRAFQLPLAGGIAGSPPGASGPTSRPPQAVSHEERDLRPRLGPATSPDPDPRAADGAAADPRQRAGRAAGRGGRLSRRRPQRRQPAPTRARPAARPGRPGAFRPAVRHRPGPPGPQLRPPDSADRGIAGAWRSGRVLGSTHVARPARSAPRADPRCRRRIREDTCRRTDPPRPPARVPHRADATVDPAAVRLPARPPGRPRDPSAVRSEPAAAAVGAAMLAWYVRDGHALVGPVKHLHERGVPPPGGKPYRGLACARGVRTNPSYAGPV